MRVWILLFLAVPFLAIGARKKSSTPNKKTALHKEKNYDHDLFRKESEVYFTNFEFLYWTITEGALDYAIKMEDPAFFSNTYASGEMKCAEFGWDPGFRVSMGYFNAPKFWEFYLQYTWLKVTKCDQIFKPDDPNRFLTGTWPQIFTTPMDRAKTGLHNQYNILDFLISRVFHPNPHLRFRLIGGLTAAFIGQRWRIDYFSGGAYTTIHNRWRFRGGGLKIGIHFDWFWRADFYITGRASIASEVGRYKNRAHQLTNFGVVGGNALPIRDVTMKDIRIVYTTMFAFGPSWQKNFDTSRFEIFAGYEFTDWFNLQEVYRSTIGVPSASKETLLNRGSFSLHGLTTRLTIDF